MHNPSSAQIQVVIDNLMSVLPMATSKCHLDMTDSTVMASDHKCGTVHCHAGWYMVASIIKNRSLIECEYYDYISYEEGVFLIAKDLGFQLHGDILRWVNGNLSLWGNARGCDMFNSEYAFLHKNKRPDGAKSLQDIVDHWTEVRDRVIQLELEQSK